MQLLWLYLFLGLVFFFVLMMKHKIEENIDVALCAVLSVFWLPILLALVYVRRMKYETK